MKYCIAVGQTTSPTTPLLLEGDFVESMRRAHVMGYDAVEIHTPDPDTLDVTRLRAACDELGMFIATLGTGMIYGKYGLYLMDEDETRQARIVDMVKHYIDIASSIGSKVTIGSIKGNVPKGADREKCLAIMGKCMQEISAHAVQQGVQVLLEATNHFENNVLNTGKDVHDFIERYGLKNVQALIDSFHVNIEERDVTAGLRDAGSYLGHIHFGDNIRWYPGSGAFDFDAFCQGIRDVGYDGVLSVEVFPLPDGETAAQKSIEFFRKHFG